MCIVLNMSTSNILFEKMIIFSPINGISGIGHIFKSSSDRFLCRCAIAEKRILQHILFSSLLNS